VSTIEYVKMLLVRGIEILL